jgi:hypothetical protein
LRRRFASAVAVIVLGGVLAGCGSDGSDAGPDVDVKKDGREVTVDNGDSSFSIGDAQLPDDFPEDDVPLPDSGALKAVVSGDRKGDEYYSLTYSVKGGNLKSVANDYKKTLEDDGYRIEASSSIGGPTASFTAFTAVGDDWDIIVYSGGDANADGALSLQVTTHDPSTDLPGS